MSNNSDFKQIFHTGSTTFYNSSIFFPKSIKNDIFTLYAFVRTADNFVDHLPQNKIGYEKFISDYESCSNGKDVDDPIIPSFVKLKQKVNISDEWVNSFFRSMKFDLVARKTITQQEIHDYVFGSAEVIGLMMSKILNLEPKAYKSARALGHAFQLINFIRDIYEDHKLGRIYFSSEDLKKFYLADLDKETVFKNPDCFKNFISFQIEKYKKHLEFAQPGFAFIPKKLRIPIVTATQIYTWTANKIQKNPFLIYEKKVKPTKLLVYLTFAKNFLTI